MNFTFISGVLLAFTVVYSSWSWICLHNNYRRAQTMGVPLLRQPIDHMNVFWLLLAPLFWRLLDSLPIDFGSFCKYARRGWHFFDKAESHLRFGPAWAVVTPVEIYLNIADPDAIIDIFARRTEFTRPHQLYKMMEVYGPNVATADLHTWQRQRKILAAPFNENTNSLVWSESLSQTRDMLLSWTRCGDAGASGVGLDTRMLSLDVLAATGFRQSYKFRSSQETTPDGTLDYRDALKTVLDNPFIMMIIPFKFLSLPFMPRSMKRIGDAAEDFRRYMMNMLEKEQSLLSQGQPGTGNLMTGFVRALRQHEKEETRVKFGADEPETSSQGLSLSEILGNIYVINFAGHDTTANTLAFSVLLLASHPEVQEWVAEELRQVVQDNSSETWDYESIFPKLRRCRAVLLETLRLYPPIPSLPKWTNDCPQELQIEGRNIIVPPKTAVLTSLLAVQVHPTYWKDPLTWQPSRWIITPPTSQPANLAAQLDSEDFYEPRNGTYFP